MFYQAKFSSFWNRGGAKGKAKKKSTSAVGFRYVDYCYSGNELKKGECRP